MKILHICNNVTNEIYQELFSRLDSCDHDQTVIAPVFTNQEVSCGRVNFFYYLRKKSLIARLFFIRKINSIYKFMINNIDPSEFDIVHAHSLFSDGALAYRLHKEYGTPYIVAVRNTDINTFYKYFFHLRGLGNRVLKNASQVIFISPAYRDKLLGDLLSSKVAKPLIEKSIVLPNGISPFWFNNMQKYRVQENKVRYNLIFVGTINKEKNTITLTDAIKMLNAQGYDLTLTLIGAGFRNCDNDLKKIEDIAQKYDYIKLCEKQPREKLLSHLRNSDIFIMVSHRETFGLVYIEALTQGLPLIYTEGQGIDGYFETGEVGYAANSSSAYDIAEKIKLLISNYYNIREKVSHVDLKQFDWNEISLKYQNIYKAVINNE